MPTGTRAEFAAHRGVHKSTVSRWEKAGRMAFDADGKVDFEKSIELIEQSADPAKQGVVIRHARERENKVVQALLLGDVDEPQKEQSLRAGADFSSGNTDESYANFNRSRALQAEENARILKMKREELEGLIVRLDVVEKNAETAAAIVKRGFSNLPARVLPLINAEPDAGKQYLILQQQLDLLLDEMCEAIDYLPENVNA